MRLNAFIAIALASTLSLVACGPSGGDDSSGDDTNAPDANTGGPPDANTGTPVTSGLGKSCTPDGADPMGQGDCDAGFVCLNLQDGSGPWCSKTCSTAQGMDPIAQCDPSLTAAKGLGYCFLNVDFDG